MKRWKNFDHWWVKMVAFLLVIGSVWWMAYAIQWHYHREHTCSCLEHWEYFPFVVSTLVLIFALAILSKKLTEGATGVVLPVATLVLERLGRRRTDPVIPTPTAITPTTPVVTPPDLGDKP